MVACRGDQSPGGYKKYMIKSHTSLVTIATQLESQRPVRWHVGVPNHLVGIKIHDYITYISCNHSDTTGISETSTVA